MRATVMSIMPLIILPLLACGSANETQDFPNVVGHWRWTGSTGGMLDDTLAADEKGATLELRADSTFHFQYGAEAPVEGRYFVTLVQEPAHGEVPMIRLSGEVPMFRPDTTFIISVSGEALQLVSPWTDSWNHQFVRSREAPEEPGAIESQVGGS